MVKTSPSRKNLLPFPVIAAAAGGNIDAINAVLKHYEGYIAVCPPGEVMTGTASLSCV